MESAIINIKLRNYCGSVKLLNSLLIKGQDSMPSWFLIDLLLQARTELTSLANPSSRGYKKGIN